MPRELTYAEAKAKRALLVLGMEAEREGEEPDELASRRRPVREERPEAA